MKYYKLSEDDLKRLEMCQTQAEVHFKNAWVMKAENKPEEKIKYEIELGEAFVQEKIGFLQMKEMNKPNCDFTGIVDDKPILNKKRNNWCIRIDDTSDGNGSHPVFYDDSSDIPNEIKKGMKVRIIGRENGLGTVWAYRIERSK